MSTVCSVDAVRSRVDILLVVNAPLVLSPEAVITPVTLTAVTARLLTFKCVVLKESVTRDTEVIALLDSPADVIVPVAINVST